MRPDVVARLTTLLTAHHHEEMRLLDLIRQGQLHRRSLRWGPHDDLERDILYAMAEATDPEITAAIDAYEADGGYL